METEPQINSTETTEEKSYFEIQNDIRASITKHTVLIIKYFKIAAAIKHVGIASPALWLITGFGTLRIVSIIAIQLMLWFVDYLYYMYYDKKIRKQHLIITINKCCLEIN